ncbi:MAG: hypothetical protein SFU56_07560 [Capsulimonadales bacterium]|nr:hypothetical protein [Capsulimonadales bacterium]
MPGPVFSPPGFSGRIGIARADITPPVGIYHRNWGASDHEQAEGIRSHLTLTVLTLEPGPLVLAAADLGWWRDPADEWYVRSAVLDALSLDPANFLLNFSHTHAGPVLCRADADRPGGHLIAPYLDFLRETLLRTIGDALDSAQDDDLEFAYGKCLVAVNRDQPDPEGRERYVIGLNEHAPADDTLLIARLRHGDALLVNYACHPTVMNYDNREISADFVHDLRIGIEDEWFRLCMFLQGASGELSPLPTTPDDLDLAAYKAGVPIAFAALATNAARPATALAFTRVVESGAPLAEWTPIPPSTPTAYPSDLRAALVEVDLPLKPEWQGETDEEKRWAASSEPADREKLRRRQRIRQALGGRPTATLPLWVWKVGDAFVVATPTEAYSRLQTELRAAFPGQPILVMNVTNGWWGYLPPAEFYDRDMYPVWQTPFAPGGLEIVIERAKKTIESLRRGPV